ARACQDQADECPFAGASRPRPVRARGHPYSRRGGIVMNSVAIDPARTASASPLIPRKPMPALFLVAGIVLAALTEAVSSTVLSMARLDMIGDTYATPDEFSRLDVGYTAAKL